MPSPRLKAIDEFRIAGRNVLPDERVTLALPIPSSAYLEASIPVRVFRAEKPGPRLFITGLVHGDEVIGIEIIRRLLGSKALDHLVRGDVILVPVVNLFGFIEHSRYVPADHEDLNRSFPGNEKSGLSKRLAKCIHKEVISQCSHGIDLHSGANNRFNLPQIRTDMENEVCIQMAKAFGAPVVQKADRREGSLRGAAKDGIFRPCPDIKPGVKVKQGQLSSRTPEYISLTNKVSLFDLHWCAILIKLRMRVSPGNNLSDGFDCSLIFSHYSALSKMRWR